MQDPTRWKVYFFTLNDAPYHLALYHPRVGFGDLSLLGSRIFDERDPLFPRGQQSVFSIDVPYPELMIKFMRLANLLCREIIDQERRCIGWHLLPEAPEFVLTLRNMRSKDVNNMNCVEWCLFALEQGGVEIPLDILTLNQFRSWLIKVAEVSQ